jgi:hypothetical protein
LRNQTAYAIIFTAMIVVMVSCKKNNPVFESLAQIEGTWVMSFDGSAVYEKWERVNDTLYIGMSYEVTDKDSVVTETLQIVSREDGIYYIPTVTDQNDGKPVKFRLALHEADYFVFENPQHDFPTNISYRFFPDNKLKAVVSGLINDEMRSLEFDYEKAK